MNRSFLEPGRLWWLLAVAGLAAAYIAAQFRRPTYALRYSNVELLDKVAPRSPRWRRHVTSALYLLGLAGLVFAMAQPVAEERVPKDRSTIILAIDTSLSMQATDVEPTRIDAAKRAAIAFVDDIPANLQVGLVAFNGTANLRVAPTTDRAAVTKAIRQLELGERTAIGEAVATSLQAIEDVPPDENGKRAPGAIVLLSDGKTTWGRTIDEIAPEAKKAKVPVSTIAYGTPGGTVEIADPETGQVGETPVPVDKEELARLAEQTDGVAFEAESESALNEVYSQLERRVGYDTERREITWKVAAWAALALTLAGALSLWWFQRLT